MSGRSQPIDRFARELDRETRDAIATSTDCRVKARVNVFRQDFDNLDELRKLAGQVKRHTLDHLGDYLEQATANLERNGVHVHFASDAEAARRIILGILQQRGVRTVVKSKSMATEEIHLNADLEASGIRCVETDLGEFIVQIDGDTPSHIVAPIMHKNRRQVARSFEKHGLGEYNDDPETITRRARRHLRRRYFESQAGITGANFVCAESGRMVLLTNEGNARFTLAPNRLHIALAGIEKIVPRDADLALFLNLLARSATAQRLTVYTQFIGGPKAPAQPSGPEEMHLVFLDNGRSRILGTAWRDVLRCIRCGACQNVCPVYRQASGHGYRAVYGGPIGSVLSPLLAGDGFPRYADLPKACSVCGACQEVCPVDIPLPDLLLRLRDKATAEGIHSPGLPPMGAFAKLATSPVLWRAAMTASRAMDLLPLDLVPFGPLQAWLRQRTLPPSRGGEFRHWLKTRKHSDDERS